MAEQTSQQGSQETVAKDKDQKQRQPKKMVSSTVKDVISKGRTMTGKKPDQIDINPVKENTDLFKQVADIYDKFFEASDRSDTYKREWGTDSLTNIYKKDTPGQVVNDKFGLEFKNPQRDKEANTRSGNPDRKEIDLVPRNDPERDRKKDSTFFRQQSITKRRKDIGEDINDAFSEAYGKGYKSPWDKIEKAKPGIGKRIDAAAAGLKQNAADYQAIIDKEKKQTKNESVNAAGAGTVRGFGNVSGNPDGSDIGNSYVSANIADADTKDNIIKAQVKAHADLHMVGKDNSTEKKVAKEEVDLDETSKSLMNRYTAKLILKHPDVVSSHPVGRDVQRKKSLNLAMDKLIPSSAIKKPKVTATEEKEVWDKPNPKKTHKHLSPSQIARAKARAKAAGRPYPNLIDNMAVAKEETIHELSNELIGKVNKLRSLGPDIINGVKPTPHKTLAGAATLNKAVEKVRKKSEVGKIK